MPEPWTVYDPEVADHYDSWFGTAPATPDTVELLTTLTKTTGPGRLLELGIGTGRLAIPLAARGFAVHGIDGSPHMAAQLHAKPGGERIPVTAGDFADVPVDGRFALTYVAAGTFFELPTQDHQVRCFANVAQHLQPGGLFVLDAHVPEVLAADAGAGAQAVGTGGDELVLRIRRLQPAVQRYTSDYLVFDGPSIRHVRVSFRYASAGELDLMAAMAGLRLRERYGNWAGARFTGTSSYHVSVYELPAD